MKKIKRKILWNIVQFLIVFNILAIPMYVVIYLDLTFAPLQNFLAYATQSALSFLGYQTSIDNFYLTLVSKNEIQQIEISWDSTGWKSLYALFALVIATPHPYLSGKLKFLIIGLPTIFLLNFIRILTTILISVNYGFQYFDIVHTFLWREGLIIAVVAIWFVWLKKINYNIGKIKTLL